LLLVAVAWSGWSATLPIDASAIAGVTVADTVVVAGGSTTLALNERTGAERWRTGESFALFPIGDDVALGQPGGRVELLDARSGDVRWSARVCPPNSYATAVRVAGDGVIAGCSGGRIARIDRHKGRVTAESDVLHVDAIDVIAPAGGCHLNIQAHQSGAILSEQDAVVDCRSLKAIMPQRQEVLFLGTVGNRAVMADQCCGLRGAMEQPVGIFTIDGATGTISPERPFVPGEPFLAGSRVCIGQHSLIRCRAVESEGQGTSDVTGLADFPVRVGFGSIGIVRLTPSGETAQLDDVTSGNFRRVWSALVTQGLPPFGNPDRFGSVPIRTVRGAEIVSRNGMRADVSDGGLLVASDEKFVFVRSSTGRLVGNRYVGEIHAIPWR
jgi:hypothetical protein